MRENGRVRKPKDEYQFWFSDTRGLIRHGKRYPEVWRDGQWVVGSPYVMDAITGMGEDPHSCGEYADQWTSDQAATYAAEHGIDLFAPLGKTA